MDIVFIIIISLAILYLLIAFTAIINNNIYNITFNRKERKAWEFAIHNIDKFEYDDTYTLGTVFRWGDYVAVIWNNIYMFPLRGINHKRRRRSRSLCCFYCYYGCYY